ncbi:TonB-dependent receptor [Psychrobacter sp. FME5]|uniref:TonB-dependent receptor n=1 Tax=Psychrobacter sp. FME5 TaxID=2487706 RepID=UPI001787B286|nr:TonB-dependent receptor [Psychrobacter sp. FME5]MBE0446286.1 TonB-dependent receptor [Psychrobacter sp. FME5]MDN5802860.1 TonB-dependent receptor [Psychrobacter sp.]
MQLSRLYSALFCLKASNRARHPFSVKSLSIFHLSTSVVLLAASQAAWAQTDINNDSQSDVPSVVLDTIVVTSSADASADGLPDAYEGGQVATGSRVGILGNQDIMDTPFSTTSYTNEYIANQQAQSVGDLLKKDPTIRVARGFGNFQEAYFMRGFITTSDDTMFNGLYGILPRQYIATELFERVEVQRGASAMLNGAAPSGGNAGGTINLLPKRASNDPLRQLTLGYGEGDQGKVAVDVSDRFGSNDAFGVRFNAAYQDGDSAIDDESATLGLAALGLDYKGDQYRLSADLGWQDNKLEETRPSVTLAGASRVPSAPKGSKNWVQPWTYSNEKDVFGTIRGEYDFNDSITAYGAYGMRRGDEDNSLSDLTVTNTNGAGTTARFDNIREDKVQSAELGLRGQWQTGKIDHDWVIAADLYDQEEKGAYAFEGARPNNLYRPIKYRDNSWSDTAVFVGNANNPTLTNEKKLQSFALADTFSLFNDKLKTTLGVRHQNIETTSYNPDTQAQTGNYDESKWTPSVGLVYQPTMDWSVYGNYIESLAPGKKAPLENGGNPVTNAGQDLAPYVSEQTEVGVKYDNGTIGSSLAIFRIDAARAYIDDTNTFTANGENRHQGAELSIFGSPSENMRLIAGVSYLSAKQKDTGDVTLDGNRVIGLPKLQSNVNLEYDLAAVEGLTLTGDIIHTGARYADNANTLKVDGYTTLDLGARYRTVLAGQDVTLKGMVTNVTGEDYWQSVGGYTDFGYLNAGEPTALKVSATFDF